MAKLKSRLIYIFKLTVIMVISAVLLSCGYSFKAAAADINGSAEYVEETIETLAAALAETDEDEYDGFLIGVDESGDTNELENNGLEYVAEGIYKADSLDEVSACISSAYIQADDVEYIEPNYYVELLTDGIENEGYISTLSATDSAYAMMNASYAASLGLDGSGIKVAVIDNGVNPAYYELQGDSIIYDSIFDDGIYYDPNLEVHGTYVASIITDIAPRATIVSIKVFNSSSCTIDNLIKAINRAILPPYSCKIINLSLGIDKDKLEVKDFTSLGATINNAINAGVIVVAAAGNSGNTTSNPIIYPAAYEGVVSVGAVGTDYARQPYSTYNAYLDCVAPGDYSTKSGTSFAAPAVAAAAAVMKQAYPALTPAMFEMLLQNTCLDLGDSGYDVYYGWGFVKLDMLLAKKTVVSSEAYDESSMLINVFLQYAAPQYINYSSAVAVNYSAEGRLLGAKILTGGGSFSLITAADEKVKLFFLSRTYQPVTDYILLAG